MINLKIVDSQSRIVYQTKIVGEKEHIVNLSDNPSGVYFVHVEDNVENKFGLYKIIKQ